MLWESKDQQLTLLREWAGQAFRGLEPFSRILKAEKRNIKAERGLGPPQRAEV